LNRILTKKGKTQDREKTADKEDGVVFCLPASLFSRKQRFGSAEAKVALVLSGGGRWVSPHRRLEGS